MNIKESPVNLHIAVPGSDNFSFGHHGGIHDLSIAIKDSDDSLKMLIDLLPKKSKRIRRDKCAVTRLGKNVF